MAPRSGHVETGKTEVILTRRDYAVEFSESHGISMTDMVMQTVNYEECRAKNKKLLPKARRKWWLCGAQNVDVTLANLGQRRLFSTIGGSSFLNLGRFYNNFGKLITAL